MLFLLNMVTLKKPHKLFEPLWFLSTKWVIKEETEKDRKESKIMLHSQGLHSSGIPSIHKGLDSNGITSKKPCIMYLRIPHGLQTTSMVKHGPPDTSSPAWGLCMYRCKVFCLPLEVTCRSLPTTAPYNSAWSKR